jgi:hypothetical protein
MPFQPDSAPKSGFVPDTAPTQQPEGTTLLSKAKSAAEGTAQGLTLGNVGNIGGAVGKLAEYLTPSIGGLDRKLESEGFNVQQPKAFDIYKEGTEQELEKSYQENPWSYRAGYVGGSAGLAGPGARLAKAAGGGFKGAAALGGAQGSLTDIDVDNPVNQVGKAAAGAGMGAGIYGAGKAAVKGLGLLKKGSGKLARMTDAQSDAYLKDVRGTEKMAQQLGNVSENPQGMVELQNQARSAINNSRGTLKAQGLKDAAHVSNAVQGKQLEINPSKLLGIDPEADAIINQAISASKTTSSPVQAFANQAGPAIPESLSLPGDAANKLKQILQKASEFGRGTLLDPQQAAKNATAANASRGLRIGVEGLDPSIAAKNQAMQEGMMLQQSLRQGGKTNPLAFVSSEAPDRMATLARAETKGAGGLFDFGNKLGAAKSISAKDVGSGVPSSLGRAAGRAGLRGVSLFEPSAKELAEFPWLRQLIQESSQTEWFMEDIRDVKAAVARIEEHTIELVKQGAVHNTLLSTHEARSLALQASQEKLDVRIQPIEKHVSFVNTLAKLGSLVLVGVLIQVLIRAFL